MGEENTKAAEVLFGNPGGDAVDLPWIDSTLNSSGFESMAFQARFDGDHEFAKGIDQTRSTLAGALHEMGFSHNSAREFGGLVKEFWDKPRAKESHGKNLDTAMDALFDLWGGDNVEANLAGATELLGALRMKSPWFSDFLAHTGMQNDERLLRILGETARHRKAMAKK